MVLKHKTYQLICFNSPSTSDQFKTIVGSYNINSFLSSFSLLKYLYVLPLILGRKFYCKRAVYVTKGVSYTIEGLSLTAPLAFVNKRERRFVRSNDILKLFASGFFLPLIKFLGRAL